LAILYTHLQSYQYAHDTNVKARKSILQKPDDCSEPNTTDVQKVQLKYPELKKYCPTALAFEKSCPKTTSMPDMTSGSPSYEGIS
jgi:hypothetical protein